MRYNSIRGLSWDLFYWFYLNERPVAPNCRLFQKLSYPFVFTFFCLGVCHLVSSLLVFTGSYVVSPDIYWYETIYGKSLHKRTNQRSNHYMLMGVTGNTTYLGFYCFLPLSKQNKVSILSTFDLSLSKIGHRPFCVLKCPRKAMVYKWALAQCCLWFARFFFPLGSLESSWSLMITIIGWWLSRKSFLRWKTEWRSLGIKVRYSYIGQS